MNRAASGIAKLKRTLRIMFLVVEINLLLWLAMVGVTLHFVEPTKPAAIMAFAGIAFAVIVQHWAYYAVYEQAKQLEPHT